MLIIEPLAGLGNRLRVLDAAIMLSQKIHKQVQIMWYRDGDCNCNFTDLFVIPPGIKHLKQRSRTRWARYQKKLLCLQSDLYFNHRMLQEKIQQQYNFEELAKYKKIYIATCHRFYQPDIYDCQYFVPIKILQELIAEHTRNFANVVGIHVRRTDNHNAIQHSPVEKFIELMHNEIERDANTKFFVATDDRTIELQLMKTFPGKIIVYKKRSLQRNDPIAMQDAVIDLFCLSKCKKLIGSYWSSFSTIAEKIGNIQKTTVYCK